MVLFNLTPSDKNETNSALPKTDCKLFATFICNIQPVLVPLLPTSLVSTPSSAPDTIAHCLVPSHIPTIFSISEESAFCVALGVKKNRHAFGGKLNPVRSIFPVPAVIVNSLTSTKHSKVSKIASTVNVCS